MERLTEQASTYRHLEKMSLSEILANINKEDQKVAIAVKDCLPKIELLSNAIFLKLKDGGRLFYIGAGTSGRLGILDASECPPTFGIPQGMVIGIIAGGDGAIRKAVEFAEDDIDQAWIDLSSYSINEKDFVVGIAASGATPYVTGGLRQCELNNILTGSISCNPNAEISKYSNYPVEVIVGPEFLSGSTRMKAGTAQKMILNMITTSVMIRLGKVSDNKMVDMQLTNQKLVDRGTRIIMQQKNISYEEAKQLLISEGSVRLALKKNP